VDNTIHVVGYTSLRRNRDGVSTVEGRSRERDHRDRAGEEPENDIRKRQDRAASASPVQVVQEVRQGRAVNLGRVDRDQRRRRVTVDGCRRAVDLPAESDR